MSEAWPGPEGEKWAKRKGKKKKGAFESGAELGGVILRDFVVPYQNGSFFRGGATLYPARRDRALVGCFDSALLYLLPDQGSSDLTNRDPDSSFLRHPSPL